MRKRTRNRFSLFDRIFWITMLFIFFTFGIICFFPYWFTSFSFHGLDFTKTGEIGDTIGGIMGPFIAIVAAILTFIAFWVQYKANMRQNEQFSIDRFENNFFELLKLHRNNVEEISIEDVVSSRKAFISMFLELTFAYSVLKITCRDLLSQNKIEKDISEEDYLNISFVFFFFGVGENSDRLALNFLEKYDKKILDNYIDKLKFVQLNYSLVKQVNFQFESRELTFRLYKPFNGHMSRLGHYYRHLYQTVKFVAEQPEWLMDREKKYQYLKTLRAQLSDHEQLLLYYNSLSDLGYDWIKYGYLADWRIIKNIPLALADFGIRPIEKLGMYNKFGEPIFG